MGHGLDVGNGLDMVKRFSKKHLLVKVFRLFWKLRAVLVSQHQVGREIALDSA